MNELYYARSENGLIIPYKFYEKFNYFRLVTRYQCDLDGYDIKKHILIYQDQSYLEIFLHVKLLVYDQCGFIILI